MCLVRNEDGETEWTEEYWLRKAEMIKSANYGDDIFSKVVMQRMQRYAETGIGSNENEYDWVGMFMHDLVNLENKYNTASRLSDDMMNPEASWKELRKKLVLLVRKELKQRQQGRCGI